MWRVCLWAYDVTLQGWRHQVFMNRFTIPSKNVTLTSGETCTATLCYLAAPPCIQVSTHVLILYYFLHYWADVACCSSCRLHVVSFSLTKHILPGVVARAHDWFRCRSRFGRQNAERDDVTGAGRYEGQVHCAAGAEVLGVDRRLDPRLAQQLRADVDRQARVRRDGTEHRASKVLLSKQTLHCCLTVIAHLFLICWQISNLVSVVFSVKQLF